MYLYDTTYKSVLDSNHPMHASGITKTLNSTELQTGHSNQCVKIQILFIKVMHSIITAWMVADSALKDAV